MDRETAQQLDWHMRLDTSVTHGLAGKRVLVVGADGFLGWHTTRALLDVGALVTVVTRRTVSHHSSSDCRVIHGDISDTATLDAALLGQEIVYDLAGSSGGVDSNRAPYDNLIRDCAPHLRLFEAASGLDKPPLIVFCSSRTVYGKPAYLPVSETHPVQPLSIYATHKAALERHLAIMGRNHDLPYVIFRLSNPYGFYPWQEGKSYGVMNQFIRKARKGHELTIYGDGGQIRDYIHVDDVVEVFLLAAIKKQCWGDVFNLGGPEGISMMSAAKLLERHCPDMKIKQCDWPREYVDIETGDYLTDLTKLRACLGPVIQTGFESGLEITLEQYRLSDRETRRNPGVAPRAASSNAGINRNFWNGRRVLITGASGFLGSHLAKHLSHRGAVIGAMHRRPLPSWLEEDPQIWGIQLDLLSPKERILEMFREFRPEYVYHFASQPDGLEEEETICRRLDCNILGTVNLLCGAIRYPVKGFVLGDSCKVYGNGPVPHREFGATSPESSYAASKLSAWHFCRVFMKTFSLPVAALRPTLVFGPGESFNLFTYLYRCLENGSGEITLDGGQQTRDPLFIVDAVMAYIRIVEGIEKVAGRVLPVGGGKELPVSELARRFLASGGVQTRVRCRPELIRPTEMMRSYCDNAEATNTLGWHPAVDRDLAMAMTFRYHEAISKGDGEAYLREWFEDILGIQRLMAVRA
jgi:nucleoside-diphosphate-sugar epimerase